MKCSYSLSTSRKCEAAARLQYHHDAIIPGINIKHHLHLKQPVVLLAVSVSDCIMIAYTCDSMYYLVLK